MYDSVAWQMKVQQPARQIWSWSYCNSLCLKQEFITSSNESSWLTQFCAEGVAAKRRYGATITPHIKHMHSFNEEDYPYYYNNNNKTI